MRKIILTEFISLDGVIQAPGAPEEDTSGGFKYGGWTAPFNDEFSGEIISNEMSHPFDLLLGRKTYDIFASYWPKQTGEIAEVFNKATKYLVSHSNPKNNWEKTVVIKDNVAEELKKLKDTDGPNLYVYGSSNFAQTLLKNDLVDELWLKTYPVTLGKGKKLFEDGTIPASFRLMDSKTSPAGVIFSTLVRNGDVETGTVE